jgi:hypothetical protein
MAEGIRTALKLLREKKQQETYRTLVERTRGIWAQGDGLSYQKKLRSEWDGHA